MERTNLTTFYYPFTPFSADPMDYDAYIHHITFRAVLSSLVSQYRNGGYTGVLAESWESSSDQKTWKFKIRKGLSFENGDPITPEIIAASLKRTFYLLQKKSSRSGLAEHLIGIETLRSSNGSFPGLIVDTKNSELTFTFKTSQPKLLENISFGLYAIAHPSDYDSASGVWKDPKKVISSGFYRVKSWTSDQSDTTKFTLTLRSDFLPLLRHSNPLTEILITNDPLIKDTATIIASNYFGTPDQKKYEHHRGLENSISYIQCATWKQKNSPCSKQAARVELRNIFLSKLDMSASNIKRAYSFFPPVMKGISEMTIGTSDPKDKAAQPNSTLRFMIPKTNSQMISAMANSINAIGERLNLQTITMDSTPDGLKSSYDPDSKSITADIFIKTTSILIEDPDADIRFMFQSKEGIRLPDTTGEIEKELREPKLNVQRINELLWEQAVIWPIGHYAKGIWAKSEIDFSMVNTLLPPTDLSLIGYK
jgi:MarR-like DNA-binding transcriptional regulator SgrR of sgrS sRNA